MKLLMKSKIGYSTRSEGGVKRAVRAGTVSEHRTSRQSNVPILVFIYGG